MKEEDKEENQHVCVKYQQHHVMSESRMDFEEMFHRRCRLLLLTTTTNASKGPRDINDDFSWATGVFFL
jgi:hypothetical protein